VEAFAVLLLAHLLGDFPLQTNWVMKVKLRHNWGVLLHALLHGLVTALLIESPRTHVALLLILVVVHFTVDWTKLRFPTRSATGGFLADQIAHAGFLALLAGMRPFLQSRLDSSLLYSALLFALLPALLVFISVRSRDTSEVSSVWSYLRQRQGKIIYLSQALGGLLIVWLIMITYLNSD
jgi:hypothetical protein